MVAPPFAWLRIGKPASLPPQRRDWVWRTSPETCLPASLNISCFEAVTLPGINAVMGQCKAEVQFGCAAIRPLTPSELSACRTMDSNQVPVIKHVLSF